MKMGVTVYLDTILVPLSVFLTVGYHAYLWHNFKNKPPLTTIGANTARRRMWFLGIEEGDDKKTMLAVQSMRNTQMMTILAASVAVILNLSLAAMTNNIYNASHLLSNTFFGLQSSRSLALKYGSASLFLLTSFLCNSMALGFFNEANFLINVRAEFSPPGYVQAMMERGFMLALVGIRLLYITFPLLLWMLGPVPVALSSVALVRVLYELDFAGNTIKEKLSTNCSIS
ncbi:hypothetical protein HHK36_016012 [Tetracentron sinense]|uniref:DUF599 domain-containing protein n=1 Tax=Tetracentron sinense TaxID=13715 RepID=A0A834Z011_TETSI|nr:hypothetical protein HHK36_016012 [Tetracentron sinense]